jgi:glycosyltransferase involved in cell wall biosynthesis
MEERKLVKSEPYIYPIETYCCNTEQFKPDPVKENIVVWAARLHLQKRPEMYLEAIHWLHQFHRDQIKGWKFLFYGNGPHREQFEQKIKELDLSDFIEFRSDVSNMSQVFNRSKCFVSTQDYENFTSLSMNEALSSGNAIVSRNVGQTDLYVKDGKNGYLAKEDSSIGVGEAILRYISASEAERASMQQYSLYLSNEVHTPNNFMKELDNFWEHVLTKK